MRRAINFQTLLVFDCLVWVYVTFELSVIFQV